MTAPDDGRGNPADPLYQQRRDIADAEGIRASFAALTANPTGTPTGVGGGSGPITIDAVATAGARRYLFTPGDPLGAETGAPRRFIINPSSVATPHPTNPRRIVLPTLGA